MERKRFLSMTKKKRSGGCFDLPFESRLMDRESEESERVGRGLQRTDWSINTASSLRDGTKQSGIRA